VAQGVTFRRNQKVSPVRKNRGFIGFNYRTQRYEVHKDTKRFSGRLLLNKERSEDLFVLLFVFWCIGGFFFGFFSADVSDIT
ncbi:MAG: hypothetical protein KFH87_12335, partial [Bacteroidetes bacterium]|nr:hypothetical protein [Bacteroidota bacterium]